VTEYPVMMKNSDLYDIERGPDGNVWFTESYGKIGRITPAGVITELHLPGYPSTGSTGVAAGPDSNVWFTDFGRGTIGRLIP
jgi:virginiamycin B lyase